MLGLLLMVGVVCSFSTNLVCLILVMEGLEEVSGLTCVFLHPLVTLLFHLCVCMCTHVLACVCTCLPVCI